MFGLWSGVHGVCPLKPGRRNTARGHGRCSCWGATTWVCRSTALEGYQAMLGVPVADATQWDQIERVADCGYAVFAQLETLAAQGRGDLSGRHACADFVADRGKPQRTRRRRPGRVASTERTGMYTTALVVQAGERTICLYYCGSRACGGEPGGAVDQARGGP